MDISCVIYECGKYYRIDSITGDKIYTRSCANLNKNGDCRHFEPNLWTRIKKLFEMSEYKMKAYVCNFVELGSDGEIIDDFSEWCYAESEEAARAEFESRYDNGRFEIVDIWED